MTNNSNTSTHLLWALGGLAFGAWWVNKEADEAKKSRAELECPDDTEEICEEIWELLAEWEPEYEYTTEDEYTRELGGYLDANSQWEVEIMPNVAGMKPDLLIGDVLAIELKLSPNKAEMDRCIRTMRQLLTGMGNMDVSH